MCRCARSPPALRACAAACYLGYTGEFRTGVHYGPGAGELRSNTVSNNTGNGIELFSTIGATIVENKSSNNGGNGIFVANGATSNMVRDNKARGNQGIDLFDGNGTPLVNTYVGNRCATSNPSGLCKS
jgi:parallel beta-helix repeat protein